MTQHNGTASLPETLAVSRRTFLAGSGLAAAGLALTGTVGQSVAHAREGGRVPEFQVSHGPSVGGNWHTFKESPDGSKVLYVTYPGVDENPISRPANVPAEIWYAWPDGTGRTKVTDTLANNHAGALQQWIDNERIIHRYDLDDDPRGGESFFVRAVNIDGTVDHVFTELPDALPIDFHDGIGKILGGRRVGFTAEPTLSDVWLLDPATGSQEKVLDASAFTPWKEIIGGEPEEWRIWHRYFNPSGTLIWIKVVTPGGGIGGFGGNEFGFTFNLAGEDIVYWDTAAERAGGHPTWWDDTRIWHPRSSQVFNRDGSVSVSARQAGRIGHGSLSSNRKLLVGESRGGRTPVNVWLYERENTEPLETLYSSPHSDVVWGTPDRGHGTLAHVNPSFSRDGKRVYVTKPVAPGSTRLMMYNVSRYARGGR